MPDKGAGRHSRAQGSCSNGRREDDERGHSGLLFAISEFETRAGLEIAHSRDGSRTKARSPREQTCARAVCSGVRPSPETNRSQTGPSSSINRLKPSQPIAASSIPTYQAVAAPSRFDKRPRVPLNEFGRLKRFLSPAAVPSQALRLFATNSQMFLCEKQSISHSVVLCDERS